MNHHPSGTGKIPEAMSTLVGLTKRGFHSYVTTDNATRLVRYDRVPGLWLKVKDGEYSIQLRTVSSTRTHRPLPA